MAHEKDITLHYMFGARRFSGTEKSCPTMTAW